MRYPSKETYQLICKIKASLNQFFSSLSNKAIEWILDSAPESRGTFIAPEVVKDFCSSRINNDDRSFNINTVDMLISAINYASRRKVENMDPEAVKAKEAVTNLISNLSPHISERYPIRNEEIARTTSQYNIASLIQNKRTYISDASGYDSEYSLIRRARKYTNPSSLISQGFVYLLNSVGIPILNHISGTLPGNLEIINSLFNKYSNENLNKTQAELFTAVSAASFYRSAFHSPIETYIGLLYFLKLDIILPKTRSNSDVMKVKELYKESLELMAKSLAPNYRKQVFFVIDILVENSSLTPQELEQWRSKNSEEASLKKIGKISKELDLLLNTSLVHTKKRKNKRKNIFEQRHSKSTNYKDNAYDYKDDAYDADDEYEDETYNTNSQKPL
jgi:hypothetical protein